MTLLPLLRAAMVVASAGGIGLLGLFAWLINRRGAPGSLLPHGYCLAWDPTLLWTHMVSDSLISTRSPAARRSRSMKPSS